MNRNLESKIIWNTFSDLTTKLSKQDLYSCWLLRFHVSPAAGYRDLSRLKNADALSGCSALKTIANYKENSE